MDQGNSIAALLLAAALASLFSVPAYSQADLTTLPATARWQHSGVGSGLYAMATSPNGRLVLSGHYQKALLWDVQRGAVARVLEGHKDSVEGLAFLDDGRAVTSDKREVVVWEPLSGRRLAAWTVNEARALRAAPGGRQFAFTGHDSKSVTVWDVAAGKPVWTKSGLNGSVTGLAYSADGKLLVTGQQSAISVWDAATGSPLAEIDTGGPQVWAVAISPDNRLVVAAGVGPLRVIDIVAKQRTEPIQPPAGMDTYFRSIAMLPSGRHVAAVDNNLKGHVQIGSLTTRQVIARSPDASNDPRQVAVSADGTRAFVGLYDGTVQVLDLSSLKNTIR